MIDYDQDFKELLIQVPKEGASDLHIDVGKHPTLRIDGMLYPLVKKPVLSPKDAEGLVMAILTPGQKETLQREKEIDFSYSLGDKIRFRVNVFYQKGYLGAAFRSIPLEIKTLRDLNLPESLYRFIKKEQGFFLVVGPTGHGKSTTLASMVNTINQERAEVIITIEDPIEYLFTQDKSIISQREIKIDTKDFGSALKSMFRQDINVAMIGEMRDYETMSAAVTAAETGHLILSSLHTNNAAQTINRIIDNFPPVGQNQIRAQLSASLLGIFSQRLIPRIGGGLIPAYELLIANTAVRNLIRENRVHEIDIVIETSSGEGMVSLNQSLIDLVSRGEITMENALNYSLFPEELRNRL
ncbi:MAG: type IV pili twitching motility protein PilT [Candidatus Tagabacteria bacterium RIFCSPLOWO2_01_FULL_39_11]|uniref:Type IV pili twitching motility protein PilT n=1 Tax=Candidatus Tagabacteria bacterium RIFCSPLOWO2_01_FULL_39_11 TaxID=1802295 RepID=A0A1G2LMP5_9BACT|nr:MAG: type IV pili twitching motility protein PilT [Candidatus Tagabacteria bacterium RIFCSPLOWO2_01_FULL_39_11]